MMNARETARLEAQHARVDDLRQALTWIMEHPGAMEFGAARVQKFVADVLDQDEAHEMNRQVDAARSLNRHLEDLREHLKVNG